VRFLRIAATFISGYALFACAVFSASYFIEGPSLNGEIWLVLAGAFFPYFILTAFTAQLVKLHFSSISCAAAFCIGAAEAFVVLILLLWWALPINRVLNELFNGLIWMMVVAAGMTAVFVAWGFRLLRFQASHKA
jgi:hypothetical protein